MGRKSRRKRRIGNDCTEILKQLNINENPPVDNGVIGIADRLCLPLYQFQDAIDEDEDMNEFHLEFRPRIYFASSLCLVCSNISSNRNFICENCKMVSYCSDTHRHSDKIKHKNLCRFLTEICQKNDGLSFARNLQPEEYRTFRIELFSILENAIGRNVDLWEREIILYPRLCRTCHCSDNLTHCPDCHMEFFCNDAHRGNHDKWCMDYQVFRNILISQRKHGFPTPQIPNVCHFSPAKFPLNFDSFVRQMYQRDKDYRSIDCSTYASLSLTATIPLTTLHSIQFAFDDWPNKDQFSIHIIGAELQFECANLDTWEKLFLHLLPEVKILNLLFVGPELFVPPEIASVFKEPKLCRICRSKGRTIRVAFHSGKLYHQVDLPKNSRPDIVCLFNPGLYRPTGYGTEDTWPKTIERFCNYKVPVLVTAYTEIEIPRDIARIRSICDVRSILEPRKNPFSSQKPDRNFVSDDVAPLIYKNYYLSVVQGT